MIRRSLFLGLCRRGIGSLKTSSLLAVILVIAMLSNASGQQIEKVFLDENDTTANCYTIIYPSELPWKGFMFILPGFGETAERVMRQSDLPNRAAKKGLLAIIPTFQDGVMSFGIDSISQASFKAILEDVTGRHKLSDQPFYIGGFSIGGSAAIKFAQTAIEGNLGIKPVAVFGIDPKLDFERYYNSCIRDIRLSKGGEQNRENVYMENRIKQVMGGTPQDTIKSYYEASPYSFSDTTQRAVKSLVNTPIRIYAEPDVNWYIRERGSDFSSMNVLDGSAMINELIRLGNTNAQLIITRNKGYRKPNNQRHPHSWSIVDSEGLIEWLLEQD